MYTVTLYKWEHEMLLSASKFWNSITRKNSDISECVTGVDIANLIDAKFDLTSSYFTVLWYQNIRYLSE